MELRDILRVLRDEPLSLNWRIHGIGFIKAYVDEDRVQRLQIYNKRFLTPGITLHHDHPWHFMSQVLSGELNNTRYKENSEGEEFNEGIISCVRFNGIEGVPRVVRLAISETEKLGAGSHYMQFADEIHSTEATDGTVTLLERRFPENNSGQARVFWPVGEEYVNADITTPQPTELLRETIGEALEMLQEEFLV